MSVWENFANILFTGGMRDRSMRSGTKLAREIQLTDWSTARNLSNRSSGAQIPRDICTHFGRYLYSAKCSWIINIYFSRRCAAETVWCPFMCEIDVSFQLLQLSLYSVFWSCRHTSFLENINSMMPKYSPKRNSFEREL